MNVKAVTYTPAGEPASVFTETWDPALAANDMVLSNGLYVFAKRSDFSQTAIQFKVCKDHAWTTAFPGSNYSFTIPSGAKYLIITYNTSGNAVNAFAISSMTVAGDNGTLFGNTWTPSAAANDMELQSDGTYKFEKTGVALSAGTVNFKACANHAWTNAWPSDNYSLSILESGNYTITIIFNPATLTVSATADLEQAGVVIPTIQLHSNITNPSWESSDNFTPAGNEETASLTLTGVTKGNYEFGVNIDGTWTSNGSAFTRDNNSYAISGSSPNCTFNADVAGDYTFTWTYATNTLAITYPAPPTYSVDFVGLASQIYTGETPVSFNATSTGVDNPTYTYYVKQGEGEYGEAVASYTFSTAGSYTVKVEVRENGAGDALETATQVVTVVDPLTLYFVNKEGWGDVNIFFFNPGKSDWPGDPMTATGDETERNHYAVYSYTVPASVYASGHTIFNTNDGATQTGNLDINSAKPYYYDGEWYATLAECDQPVLTTNFYLAGSFNGWSATANRFMKATEDATEASVTITIDEYSDITLKVIDNGAWCGGSDAITKDATSATIAAAGEGGNISMTPYAAGDYIFTLNLSTRVLTVTYPAGEAMPVPANIFLSSLELNNWAAADPAYKFTVSGDVATLEVNLAEKTDYAFKIVHNASWYGVDWNFNYYWNTDVPLVYEGEEATLSSFKAGVHTFTYTISTGLLTISFPHTTATSITIGSHEYATLYSATGYDVPNAVEAYMITGNSGTSLTLERIYNIPANTGVLLHATAGSYDFYEGDSRFMGVDTENNLLKGTVDEATIADNGKIHYVLSYDNSGNVGFFWPSGTGATQGIGVFTNGAGKAYLELGSQSAGIIARRGFPLVAEQATGIDAVKNGEKAVKFVENGQLFILRDGKLYNAQGLIVK